MAFALTFTEPWIIGLFIPLLLLLFLMLAIRFVRFKDKKTQEEYEKTKSERARGRVFVGILRALAILCLLVAIAGPFAVQQVVTPGDQTVTVLADISKSFEIFDTSVAPRLKDRIDKYFPTQIRYVATDETSAIGDGVLANIKGNDNILLVSDGNNNYGRNLDDIIYYASTLNSTVNAIKMSPVKNDVSIQVLGPRKTVSDVENSFTVQVDNPSNLQYHLVVDVDGKRVVEKTTTEEIIPFSSKFTEGVHKITASVNVNDHFKQNNIFYKTIEVLDKPNILFISVKESPMLKILNELYNVEKKQMLPDSLDKYHAVILNDMPGLINSDVDLLSEFVIDGNGLIVLGGETSYNFGDYEDTLLETLLPVNIGTGGRKEGDINTVLCIDISGSTGKAFSQSGAKKVDVEKAQALSILKDFKPTDNVGVLAFNVNAFLLSGVSPLESKYQEVANKILTLQDGGGTVISTALKSAAEILIGAEGTKNIVVISDGKTKHLQETFRTAEQLADFGIRIYTVGIGKDTHVRNLEEIARLGRGNYFEPDQSQRLRILFGRPPETEEGKPMQYYPIVPVDNAHFITKDLDINASIGGYNQVVPKSAAQHLVSTIDGSPVVVVWRFGLGKVVTIATDDGSKYAGPLLRPQNSQLISRSINWAVGDLARRSVYFVDAKDTYVDKPIEITVKSQSMPSDPKIELSKIDKDLYSGVFHPTNAGFIDILGTTIAVNYNSEYADVGINPLLEEAVKSTGGQMLNPDEVEKIVELIKVNSRRIKTDNVFYRWLFILAALVLFLIDVCVRRFNENRKLK